MEVYELELVAHFLLLCDLVGCLDDLSGEGGFFVLVFLDQGAFLSILLLEEFLNALGLDVACSAVLAAH